MKKKIILSSVLSIVICLSLIAGATYAFFTSEAKVNIAVTSGSVNLTATLTGLDTSSLGRDMNNGEFELGGYATIEGDTLKMYRMAPGDKATVVVDIENNSDIDIQYCVKLIGSGELIGALESVAVIEGVEYAIGGKENSTDWIYVDGGVAINDIAISVLMPHTTGNEYQGKSAEIAIQIIAIQSNAADALFVNGVKYDTLDDAIDAAVNASAPIEVTGNLVLNATDSSNGVVDLQGVTFEGLDYSTITFKNADGSNIGGTNTFKNFNLKNITVIDETFYTAENGENAWEWTYLEFDGTNTFENVVFTDGIMLDGSNTFVDCTFTGHNNDSSEYGNGAMYGAWVNSGVASFTKCDFVGTRGLKAHEAYGSDVTKVTVEACSFGPLSEKPGIAIGKVDATTAISVANSSFVGVQAGDQGKYIYETDTDVATFAFTLTNNSVDAKVDTSDAIDSALNNGYDVTLNGDVTAPDSNSNGYGSTALNVTNGQTIDGQGNTLSAPDANGTWDSAINITSGTIKNLTVDSGFRGIFINHNGVGGKVYLENVIVDGPVYTISCDQGTGNGLEAVNSTFNGWTSYAATIGNVSFTDCNFGEGSGYAYCRPYAPTEFVGCNFEAGYEIDARAAVTFENCYLDGVLITDANVAELVTSNTSNATVK